MNTGWLTPIAVIVGFLLVAASFAWPQVANRGPGAWTEAMAQQHARTRAELHAAAHVLAHKHGSHESHGDADEAASSATELQQRFEAELAQLDAARNRGETGARLLWWGGASLVLIGAALHWLRRNG